jgi:hypothetical protein
MKARVAESIGFNKLMTFLQKNFTFENFKIPCSEPNLPWKQGV